MSTYLYKTALTKMNVERVKNDQQIHLLLRLEDEHMDQLDNRKDAERSDQLLNWVSYIAYTMNVHRFHMGVMFIRLIC